MSVVSCEVMNGLWNFVILVFFGIESCLDEIFVGFEVNGVVWLMDLI